MVRELGSKETAIQRVVYLSTRFSMAMHLRTILSATIPRLCRALIGGSEILQRSVSFLSCRQFSRASEILQCTQQWMRYFQLEQALGDVEKFIVCQVHETTLQLLNFRSVRRTSKFGQKEKEWPILL